MGSSGLTRRLAGFAGLVSLACVAGSITPALADPGTGFTYQGSLRQNGTPVDGMRDMRFRLYDTESGGSPIATIQAFGVEIAEGLFSVEVDFGAGPWAANQQLWVEIEAGPADQSQSYEIIGRQKLTATPYALNTRGISVSSAGNVGIGTDTPARLLHLDDGFVINSDTIQANTDLLISSQDAGLTMVSDQSGSVGSFLDLMEQDGAGTLIDNWSMIRRTPAENSRLEFRYGPNRGASVNDLVMSMLPNGNVGLGVLAPQTTLETGGQIRVQQGGPNPNDGSGLEISYNPTTGAQLSAFDRTLNEPRELRLNPFGGNVGIGTFFPEARLQVGNLLDTFDNFIQVSSGSNSGSGNRSGIRLAHVSSRDGFEIVDDNRVNADKGLHFINLFGTPDTRLFIDRDTGNVGLGTTDPFTDLHVNGNSYFSLTAGIAALPTLTAILELGGFSGVANALTVRTPFPELTPVFNITREGTMISRTSSGTAVVVIGNNAVSSSQGFQSNGGEVRLMDQTGTEQLTLRAVDVQGVGTVGVGRAYQFVETSDARYKDRVETIDDALETVGDLRGVTYVLKDVTDPQTLVGFIAQEVEEVVPSLVMTDEDGMKSVAYSKVTALLVEAVKEQQAGIDARDARIDGLEARLEALETSAATENRGLFGASILWPMVAVGGVSGVAFASRGRSDRTRRRRQ